MSLVPVAALILAVVFAGGVLILPILYSELVKNYVVSEGVWFRGHVTSLREGGLITTYLDICLLTSTGCHCVCSVAIPS